MNHFQQSLDKYLTTPPDDGFDNWCEDVMSHIPDHLYYPHEQLLNQSSGVCNKWLNKLFDKEYYSLEASQILMRAITIYQNKIA